MILLLIICLIASGTTGQIYLPGLTTDSAWYQLRTSEALPETFPKPEYSRDRTQPEPPTTLFKRQSTTEDPVRARVKNIRHRVLFFEEPQNSFDALLDDQEKTQAPPPYEAPPPPPPPPVTLALKCSDAMYRLAHSNTTCKDWIHECIDGKYHIRKRLECKSVTDDHDSRLFIDPACAKESWRKAQWARCQPWVWQQNLLSCRHRVWFSDFPVACTRDMIWDPNLMHCSRYQGRIDPRCSDEEFREEHSKLRCRPWFWQKDFHSCRVVGGKPGYRDDEFCRAVCMRDPKCPFKDAYKQAVREKCRRKRRWAEEWADVCQTVT